MRTGWRKERAESHRPLGEGYSRQRDHQVPRPLREGLYNPARLVSDVEFSYFLSVRAWENEVTSLSLGFLTRAMGTKMR